MAQLTVRKLDDDVVRRLKIRAAENGRSTEAEVRSILTEAVPEKMDAEEYWKMVDEFRRSTKGRITGDSTDIIREMRDSR